MNYLIYCILIITTIFQDFILGYKIGMFGKSLTGFITPILFILYMMIYRRLKIDKWTKKLINLFLYMQIINAVILLIYVFILDKNVVILGENVFFKTIKVSLYLLVIIMYLILVNNLRKLHN
ncbi:hypothetical protein CPAL_01830 [Clostridium thermopalmarium DSM 5974]|jgi:tellurite resistance protein TehA-like permease|uniref:Uncharacterized protein n=1 Tax=Clostridium thermopalmarium DSM 5974 TaxID=1121340 RepID=A0A2T0AZ70_9CLOT|nr:hypothetical protein CPAL_01830 [Clostridium thermopalmarium DSM 5974]PVZ28375.1 hypothetical protein LX19_00347 [Clostridium thermopalmarium DSM 5974]